MNKNIFSKEDLLKEKSFLPKHEKSQQELDKMLLQLEK